MDLRTIHEHLSQRSRYVRRPERFAADVELICANAKAFNVDGSPVFIEALHMLANALPRAKAAVEWLQSKVCVCVCVCVCVVCVLCV